MAHLEVLIPDRDPIIVPLSPNPLVIGRSDDCDVQVPSKFVSTRHTSIQLTALIRDLGSTNGTWVGDEQVKERALADGEGFHFGWRDQVKLRVVLDGDAVDDGTAQVPGPEAHAELAEQSALIAEQKAEIDRLSARIEELRESAPVATPADEFEGSAIISQPTFAPPDADLDGDDEKTDFEDSDLTIPEALLPKRDQPSVAPASDREPEPAEPEPLPPIEPAPPAIDPKLVTDLEAKVDRLEEDLASERSQSKKLAAERQSLLAQIRDLETDDPETSVTVAPTPPKPAPERTPAAAPPRAPAAPSREPASAGDSDDFVRRFAETCELELDEPILETMRRRPGIHGDLGYVCGRLLSFSRKVEQIVSHMSLEFRGTSRLNEGNVTVLPGGSSRDNLRRAVQGLLLQGDDEVRSAFDGHLDHLGKWYIACVTAYTAGFEKWYPDFRSRLDRPGIQKRIDVGGFQKAFGLQYREYWEEYGRLLEDLTEEIIIDELDQAAAREAVRIAEGGQG
ncbi:MAG: FHA domain-containing protein [Planctomycetota bacterium]